ncbi:MAG: elongation factor Ts [Dehalococcoidia bacterium]
MQIAVEQIRGLRERTGAGLMDCKKALANCEGDIEAAAEALRERGYSIAEKKKERAMGNGLVEAYVHSGGRVGALVLVTCETDFVAQTPEFKELAHDIAMQVTATDPQYLSPDEVPEDENPEEVCLLSQPFIKDPQKTISDIVVEVITKVGENIGVSKFCRFETGGE